MVGRERATGLLGAGEALQAAVSEAIWASSASIMAKATATASRAAEGSAGRFPYEGTSRYARSVPTARLDQHRCRPSSAPALRPRTSGRPAAPEAERTLRGSAGRLCPLGNEATAVYSASNRQP